MIMSSTLPVLHAVIFSYYLVQYAFGKPNIIFVLTDDQDVDLKSMVAMPNVISEIANKGFTFTHAYANTPVCCPSRTETVSGRTYHNAKQSNTDCQGVSATYNVYENPNSLFNKFHNSGQYITAAFGKVTNDMDFCGENTNDISSFDRFHVSCEYRDFFYSSNFNKYVGETNGDEEIPTLNKAEDIYQTAQLGNATVNFIKEQLLQQQTDSNHLPFITWIAPYAPHAPADPAPWHQNEFSTLDLLRTANYNPDVVTNYHPPISENPQITADAEEFMLLLYRDRLRSLLAVDDMVKEIVDAVDQYNAWDNTYLIYTSDHGYHIGQYRLPCGKYMPYEETTRIPLYVRGPMIAAAQQGASIDAMIQNIDFLPTFLSLAEITFNEQDYDGRSFTSILSGGDPDENDIAWRQMVMFEYHTIKGGDKEAGFNSCAMWQNKIDDDNPFGQTCTGLPDLWVLDNADNNWRVIRVKNSTHNWFYGEFVEEIWDDNAFESPYFYEFYDMLEDEFQQKNRYYERDLEYLTDEFFAELHVLVMSYGVCCGAESCSPMGNERPAQAAGTCETSSSGGSGSGGGKTGKTKSAKTVDVIKIAHINIENGWNNWSWSAKNISYVLSGATIVGLAALIIGICIGTQLQKKFTVNATPKQVYQ